jgi:hypothetical protein
MIREQTQGTHAGAGEDGEDDTTGEKAKDDEADGDTNVHGLHRF